MLPKPEPPVKPLVLRAPNNQTVMNTKDSVSKVTSISSRTVTVQKTVPELSQTKVSQTVTAQELVSGLPSSFMEEKDVDIHQSDLYSRWVNWLNDNHPKAKVTATFITEAVLITCRDLGRFTLLGAPLQAVAGSALGFLSVMEEGKGDVDVLIGIASNTHATLQTILKCLTASNTDVIVSDVCLEVLQDYVCYYNNLENEAKSLAQHGVAEKIVNVLGHGYKHILGNYQKNSNLLENRLKLALGLSTLSGIGSVNKKLESLNEKEKVERKDLIDLNEKMDRVEEGNAEILALLKNLRSQGGK